MANAGTLTVMLRAVTAEFSKKVKEAEADLKSWEGATKAAAIGATAAFAGMTAALAYSFHQFNEAQQAAVRASSAFKAAGNAFDPERANAFASALEKVTTFGDDTVIAAQGILGSFGLLQSQTESLMPRIADFAALSGTDLATAAQLVGRSIQSGTNALQRQGVVMTEAQARTFQAASATDRLQYMMGLLNKKAGGASQALAQTAGGALEQFKNAFGNLAEEVGGMIAGPVGEGLKMLTTMINAVQTAFASLSPTMKYWIGVGLLVATSLAGLTAGAFALAAAWPTLVAAFALVKAAALAAGTALLPILINIALVAAALAAVVLVVGILKKAWDSDFLGMRTTIMSFVNWVRDAWKAMIEKITGAWKATVAWFNKMMGTEFGKGASSAMDAVGEALGTAWEGTKDAAGKAADFTVSAFKEGAGVIKDAFSSIFAGLKMPSFGDGGASKAAAGDTAAGAGGPIDVSGGTGTELAGTPAKKKVNEATNKALDGLSEGAGIFADTIKGSSGMIGEVADAAMQGFQAGGPWGALIAVIAQLLTHTKGFMDIIHMFDEVIGQIVQALNPLMEGLKPLMKIIATTLARFGQMLGALTMALGPILELVGNALIPIFNALDPVFRGLFEVVRGLGLLVAYIALGIAKVWNGILEGIATVFDKLGDISVMGKHPLGFLNDWADGIRNAKVSTSALTGAIDDLKDATLDTTMAEMAKEEVPDPCNPGANTSVCEAANAMADAARTATESLTNVPSGYKMALARFDAMSETPAAGSSLAHAGSASDSSGNRTTIFEKVEIKSDDPRGLFEEFKRMMQMEAFLQGGSPVVGGGPYAIPRTR